MILFETGFEYKGVKYGWRNKELWRFPFKREGCIYGLKLIKPNFIIGKRAKTPFVRYNVQRRQFSAGQLQTMTKIVNWQLDLIEGHADCPFQK